MRKFFSVIMALITSFFVGVTPVDVPVKVYNESSYYTGFVNTTSPDYRSIYRKLNASSIESQAESSKAAQQLKPGFKPLQAAGTQKFIWLWGIKYVDPTNADGSVNSVSFPFLEVYSESNTKGYKQVKVGADDSYL